MSCSFDGQRTMFLQYSHRKQKKKKKKSDALNQQWDRIAICSTVTIGHVFLIERKFIFRWTRLILPTRSLNPLNHPLFCFCAQYQHCRCCFLRHGAENELFFSFSHRRRRLILFFSTGLTESSSDYLEENYSHFLFELVRVRLCRVGSGLVKKKLYEVRNNIMRNWILFGGKTENWFKWIRRLCVSGTICK